MPAPIPRPCGDHPFCGILSDTHGVWRDEISRAFQGAELILHAGDVGEPERVLRPLEHLAPVYHVRGNSDRPSYAQSWPWDLYPSWRGLTIGLTHDLSLLDLDPHASGLDVLVHGHTHQPNIREEKQLLLINPGSAGTGNRPFSLSLAFLWIENGRPRGHVHTFG